MTCAHQQCGGGSGGGGGGGGGKYILQTRSSGRNVRAPSGEHYQAPRRTQSAQLCVGGTPVPAKNAPCYLADASRVSAVCRAVGLTRNFAGSAAAAQQ